MASSTMFETENMTGNKSLDQFFAGNGNQQNWYSAHETCRHQNGILANISSSETKVRAQIFIANYASSDRISGFWIGQNPDSENKCWVMNQFGLIFEKMCSDSFDVNTGFIYLGLCEKSATSHKTAVLRSKVHQYESYNEVK